MTVLSSGYLKRSEVTTLRPRWGHSHALLSSYLHQRHNLQAWHPVAFLHGHPVALCCLSFTLWIGVLVYILFVPGSQKRNILFWERRNRLLCFSISSSVFGNLVWLREFSKPSTVCKVYISGQHPGREPERSERYSKVDLGRIDATFLQPLPINSEIILDTDIFR